jgi:5,10-methylenetetrahydromethanopterin reductase
VRIGINTNASASGGRPATVDQMIEQVAGLAESGFDTAAFAQLGAFDVLTLMAVIGRVVPRIEFETAVVPIYGRHPIALAQEAITVQAAIGGRLLLGIGLSHKPVVEQRWGLSFERPAEYMQEYLAILQPLLRGEAVDFAGKRLKAQTQLGVPETPAPSVVLAALGERMLRIAGAQADGTALWLVGPKTLRDHIVPIITEAAREAGRLAPRILVGLPICVTNDVAAARERAARGLAGYNQLPSYRAVMDRERADGPADLLIAGSEDDVSRQLDELKAAGATDFTAAPLGSREEHLRTAEFLRSRVTHGRGTPV